MRDALRHGMKPILFIMFLALGPALADQLGVVPRGFANALGLPEASRAAAAADPGAVARVTAPAGRAWLCGRGS
jgi:hypothetical protein